MKKFIIGVLCLLGLFTATVSITAEVAVDVKPEITSIKPGFKAL
ncbi:hypothetical protein [Psychrobacillus sp. FSL K6-1267]